MDMLENITFDELDIGQRASYTKTLTERDVALFAEVSGDVNPVHLDAEFAAGTMFRERIGHGMWTGAVVSAAIALKMPGPGSIYVGQTLSFRAPVKIGDTVTVELEVTAKRADKRFVTLECTVRNQNDKVVATGTAEVMAPAEKLRIAAPQLPPISVG